MALNDRLDRIGREAHEALSSLGAFLRYARSVEEACYRYPNYFPAESSNTEWDVWTDLELFEYDANCMWIEGGRSDGFWEGWPSPLFSRAQSLVGRLAETVSAANRAFAAERDAESRNFRRALSLLCLPQDEADYVLELVKDGERGDAFEVMCDCAFAGKSAVSEQTYEAIARLGKAIGAAPMTWEILEDRVSDVDTEFGAKR